MHFVTRKFCQLSVLQSHRIDQHTTNMKIESVRDSFLSDYEVLQFLCQLERKHNWGLDDENEADETTNSHNRRRKKKQYNHPELQAITRDTVRYLSLAKTVGGGEDGDAPEDASHKKSPLTRLNDARFTELMVQLNQFPLFKAEKLQIVNQLPTNLVHLYAIVEECDARFSEEEVNQILQVVQAACA